MDILQIELLSDNIDETVTFYSETIGFKILKRETNRISLTTGKSVLTFIKSDYLHPKYHFAFNIPCNKIDEAIAWLSSRTALIKINDDEIIANFDSWNANAIYFYDNNGNILEFIARHDLNNASDKNFDVSSVESISEIGIVADSPVELADELIETHKLSLFTKAAKSDLFSVLGDDNGLFVIVKTNRIWYPTNLPAEKFFTRIKIRTDNEIVEFTINGRHDFD